jgi:hypothetical protein
MANYSEYEILIKSREIDTLVLNSYRYLVSSLNTLQGFKIAMELWEKETESEEKLVSIELS